jgi:hypothetical protein
MRRIPTCPDCGREMKRSDCSLLLSWHRDCRQENSEEWICASCDTGRQLANTEAEEDTTPDTFEMTTDALERSRHLDPWIMDALMERLG